YFINGIETSMKYANEGGRLLPAINTFLNDFEIEYEIEREEYRERNVLRRLPLYKRDPETVKNLIHLKEWEILFQYLFLPGKVVNRKPTLLNKSTVEFILNQEQLKAYRKFWADN